MAEHGTGDAGRAPIGAARLQDFLDALARPAPVPGGGAVSAVLGACAAALVAMAAGVTARHAPAPVPLAEILAAADRLRRRLLELAAEDAEAYAEVVAARRLPPDRRGAALRSALARATEVPLEVAAAGARLLGACAQLVGRVRPSARPDLGVAAAAAWAAVESATLTARANLEELDGGAEAGRTEAELARLAGEAAEARARVLAALGRSRAAD